jgi:hypothetical protein
MMRVPVACGLVVSTLFADAALAQQSKSVHGVRLEVDLRAGPRMSGELLAVERDTLWLLPSRGRLGSVPLADVTRAQIPHHGVTRKKILLWALAGGVVTGAALAAACSSVDEGDCGAVFPITLVSWGIVGGISALATAPAMHPITADAATLTSYARFPQGMPEGYSPGDREEKPRAESASSPKPSE